MSEAQELSTVFYVGRVTHRRFMPRRHALAYRIFYVLLDLDELDRLNGEFRFFSRNCANLLSFHDSDHLTGETAQSLREKIGTVLAEAGIDLTGGRVKLLCMPRVLGRAFNPLSVHFCHAASGELVCMLYEVKNTFGERHTYVVPVTAGLANNDVIRQACSKRFYVSPFLDMDLAYRFRIERPSDRLSFAVLVDTPAGAPVLAAAFVGGRRSFSDRTVLSLVAAFPFLSVKVLAAIHWEALRIWLKGIGIRTRSPAPADGITVVASTSEIGSLS